MNSIKINYIIHNNYKDLINKNIYEKVLLEIMNESNIVFPEHYKHIDEQSNGESDFISIDSGELIDAKIIFPKKQCEKLSRNDLNDFYEMIVMETNDVYDALIKKKDTLNSTILYKEIFNAFNKIKAKENVIIFIPFPFTLEFERSLSSLFSGDIFSQIIYEIRRKKSCYFQEHCVYFIYPNLENKIILKNLSTSKTEYLKSNHLSKYIFIKDLENKR